MSDEEAEGPPAQNPAAHFSGNIMNFERQKFNARQEKRLEALKAFKKKCGYIFKRMYRVFDDDLKKKLLGKGNTLTRIQAVSIGKAHETTNQEVQECALKPPVSDSTNVVFKDKPNKGPMCNYCANEKGSHSLANKRHCPAWGAVCSLCKIKDHFKASKESKRLQKERKAKPEKQRNSRSTKKPFL